MFLDIEINEMKNKMQQAMYMNMPVLEKAEPEKKTPILSESFHASVFAINEALEGQVICCII